MSASARVRARAARTVAEVAAHGRSLDDALEHAAQDTRQERGLLRSLSYDTIRWYVQLDACLARLLTDPRYKLDPEVRALALVGLCQLLHTDIAQHAAVDETVNAARALGRPRAASLINAVLRRAQREREQLIRFVETDRALRTAHPQWLVDAFGMDWGDRADELLVANNERPPFWIRVNRRRSTGGEYRARLEASGLKVAASLFDDEALRLERALDVHDLPGFDAGDVSVQDAAAQWAARLVAPAAGHRVLDACAAPGGKTGHLLELAPELAELTAVDASSERLERVADNLQRLGVSARLIAGDAAEPAQWSDGRPFDRILLDAPCSGSGVIRRHPDIKLLRRASDIPALAARQLQMLRALWPLLAPTGRLVYASCSALRAETTDVVASFLASEREACDRTAQCVVALGHSPQDGPGHRIATGTAGMDGFYYACLEKR